MRPIIKNFGELTEINGNFINNITINSLPNGPMAEGGALYNGTTNEDASNTAIIGKITGDFIGNTAECSGGNIGNRQYGDGGAISNEGFNGGVAIIGDITGNFIGNTASGDGGAIHTSGNSGTAKIGNLTGDFIGNTAVALSGGAIYAAYATIGTITGDFIGNFAGSHGGAIYTSSNTTLGNITGDFIQNKANYGSGGAIHNSYIINAGADGYALKGDFIGNSAFQPDPGTSNYGQNLGLGGAIYNSGMIQGGILGNFYGNSSVTYSLEGGGAIYNTGTIQGDIVGDFASNTTNKNGGAIFNSYKGVFGNIQGDFTSNVATGSSGGAICSTGTMGNIYGNFDSNTAGMNGGAIHRIGKQTYGTIKGDFTNNTAGISGGAIFGSNTYQLIDSNFTNNTATTGYGGALYSTGAIEKIDGNFHNNSAGAGGGAIYTTTAINTLVSDFSANTTASGSGGAINTTSTIGTAYSDFNSNTAGVNGGAIYSTSSINAITGDFNTNSAGADGGAIYTTSYIYGISGNFEDNHADGKGGAIYSKRLVGFLADGADYNFTNNYMGTESADTYNALYLAGEYSAHSTANFTMKNDGTFVMNDSIIGEYYFTVNIAGDNVATSAFTMNDKLTDSAGAGSYGKLTLQNATMNLGSFAHNVGTTYGSVKMNNLVASQKALMNLTLAENTLWFSNIALDPSATLDINTVAGAIGAVPNVTTKTLSMETNSILNLTGDTFMQVGTPYTTTLLAKGTINVGDENPTAAGASKLDFVRPFGADATTINVRGADSLLTVPTYSYYKSALNNGSALTVSDTATATIGTDVIMNASSLSALSGGTVTLKQMDATGSRITVDGENSSLTTQFGTTALKGGSVFTVSNKGTANLSSLSASDASQFIVKDTQGANLVGSLYATGGSAVSLVDTNAADTNPLDRTTLSLNRNATFNASTLALTEGATYKTSKGVTTTMTNGGLIQIQGGDAEGPHAGGGSGKGTGTFADMNLSGDLVLDGTTIDIGGGADLRMDFNEGAVITALGKARSTVYVHGEGSSLLVTVDDKRPAIPPQNVVLALDDHATFKSDTPAFAFIGAAGLDNVLNVSAFNGSYMRFNNAYLSNADIKIADTGTTNQGAPGGYASAFVANELALERGTFTVRNSYAQTNQLFDSGATLNTHSTNNTLGGGSALRVAAGGIFVLGNTGALDTDMQTTSKELYAGLAAFNDPSFGTFATTGVTGTANVKWAGLGYDKDGKAVTNDNAHGFSIDGAHSAFIVTGGQNLNVGAGSGLIIDADAEDMISGGANSHLIANIPLYIGHDDVLLIDNTDNKYNNLGTGKGVIHIQKNAAMDTSYILSTGSKIRVVVNNAIAATTPADTKFAVIYDENHAGDQFHPAGTYHGDIFFVMGNPAVLGDKASNKFQTCSHVGGDDAYFDDNRVIMKGPGTIIIENVKLDGTPAVITTTGGPMPAPPASGVTAAPVAGDTYTVYEFKMNVEGVKPNFGVEDELFKSLVNVYLAQDTSLNSKDDATRFLTKTTVYATEKHDKDAAIKLGSVTEIAVVGGVANMAHDVMSTSTNALGNYLDYGITTIGAYDEKGSFSLWGIPLYNQSTVDGIKVGSIEGGYETELMAGIVGIDVRNNSGRVGVSFTAGVGETSSTRDFLQTENDTDFYGGGLYGQYKFGDLSFRADLGYYMTENSLDQESCYADFSNVTADVDATILTAGIDASYLFHLSESWGLKPHVGARYSMYNQDEFASQVNGNDFFVTKDADMNLISVPLGVSLLTSYHIGDWTLQPRLDASVIFNFGDTSVDNNITAPSLQSFGTANIEADILDEYVLSGSLGLDVNYDAFTFGLDYSFQQSERRTAHGVFGTIRYEF